MDSPFLDFLLGTISSMITETYQGCTMICIDSQNNVVKVTKKPPMETEMVFMG